MSDLWGRCKKFLKSGINGERHFMNVDDIEALETLVKAERINALQEARNNLETLNRRPWDSYEDDVEQHLQWIDAEIAKLKEGG